MEAFSQSLAIANYLNEGVQNYLFIPDSRSVATHFWSSKAPHYILNTDTFSDNFSSIAQEEEPMAIVIHGLFNQTQFEILEKFGKKIPISWVIWGGDLYSRLSNYSGDWPLKRINDQLSLVHGYRGDYEIFSKAVGGARTYLVDSELIYPIPTIGGICAKEKQIGKPYLIIGNSGDPTNNHGEILMSISQKNDHSKFSYLIPMSYNATPGYIKDVEEIGAALSLDIEVLKDFIGVDEYADIIQNASGLVTCHNRQQSAGTLITAIIKNVPIVLKRKIQLASMECENPMWESIERHLISPVDWAEFDKSISIENALSKFSSEAVGREVLQIKQSFGGCAERIVTANSRMEKIIQSI